MISLGKVLDRYNGFGPGFDFARIALATAVLAWHSPMIVLGNYGPAIETAAWVLNYSILPMFFGLSGFLVAGSAQRLSLSNFAVNRGLRILPALAVEIILSAFVLGPLFTNLDLTEYFREREFFTYFLNIIGFIHYRLPGVFTSNPAPNIVNGSLWTVPFEIVCYLVMALLIVTGVVKRGLLLLLASVLVILANVALQFLVPIISNIPILNHGLSIYLHGGKGLTLLPCFLLGSTAYALRYYIPFNRTSVLLSASAVLIVGLLTTKEQWSNPWLGFVVCPALTYCIIYIGLSRFPKLPFFSTGDYSYGIYLYGFPIQQAIIAKFPTVGSWVTHLGLSLMLVTAFATLSWHFVEKPILRLRKSFSFVSRRSETSQDLPGQSVVGPSSALGANNAAS